MLEKLDNHNRKVIMADTDSTVQFRIDSIDVPHYSCSELDVGEISQGDILIQFGWAVSIQEEERKIMCAGTVRGFFDPSNPIHIFDLTARCFFEVQSFDKFERDGDTIKIPNIFLENLLSINYSTMRGMLFERLASTIYKRLVLPPADPHELLESGLHKNDQ